MRKVLIVEDDIFISAIFSFFIKDLGHHLAGRCQTGPRALEFCKDEKPDVVLMDIHLEGEMDGIQTAERIQRDFDIPVIFVSSDTSTSVVERAIISNSYGYLVKPVQKNELGISIDLAYYKHKLAVEQKRREQSYRAYLSESPMPVIIIQEGSIRYLNMNALDLFRTHYMEDIIGLPLLNFVADANHMEVADFISDDMPDEKKSSRINVTMKTAHGMPFEVAMMGSVVKFSGHKAHQLVLNDISIEKNAIKNYQRLRKAIIESSEPVVILNNELSVVEYNEAFEQLVKPSSDMKHQNVAKWQHLFQFDEAFLSGALNEEKAFFETSFQISEKHFPVTGCLTGEPCEGNQELILRIRNLKHESILQS
ncbi:response regulator [Alkaliflexus imshenetskii]|uniref:response regulator n=1 Tax=Alkaliflexus imshenetskii TaxID=286730 RepID=UPI0004B72656|nr:response regulator [Alkaliflexus imshenetskii]